MEDSVLLHPSLLRNPFLYLDEVEESSLRSTHIYNYMKHVCMKFEKCVLIMLINSTII